MTYKFFEYKIGWREIFNIKTGQVELVLNPLWNGEKVLKEVEKLREAKKNYKEGVIEGLFCPDAS